MMQQVGAATSRSFPKRKGEPTGSVHSGDSAPVIRHDWIGEQSAATASCGGEAQIGLVARADSRLAEENAS